MSKRTELTIELPPEEVFSFCGKNDHTIKIIEKQLSVKIVARGNHIKLIGHQESVLKAEEQIKKLLLIHKKEGKFINKKHFDKMISDMGQRGADSIEGFLSSSIPVPLKSKRITPITATQHKYVDTIQKNDIVFGIGPAGTGKTYLAMTMAVYCLVTERVSRIILVRPAVEAGERLGFLPGDIAEKFDPYVRPLYDALFEMLDPEKINAYRESGIIEIAPLAFMRGRTLNKAFVILDEGQNTSIEQMKMFLTRLGADSKAVITGDVTQTDLPENTVSGLIHVQHVLKNIDGIEFVYFAEQDIVRHNLVRKIVAAYDSAEKSERFFRPSGRHTSDEYLGGTSYDQLVKKLGNPSRRHHKRADESIEAENENPAEMQEYNSRNDLQNPNDIDGR